MTEKYKPKVTHRNDIRYNMDTNGNRCQSSFLNTRFLSASLTTTTESSAESCFSSDPDMGCKSNECSKAGCDDDLLPRHLSPKVYGKEAWKRSEEV